MDDKFLLPFHADFMLRAPDNSMIQAGIHNNDIVFIRSQSSVSHGELAAVFTEGVLALRQVYYYNKNQFILLLPRNPVYKPLVYNAKQIYNFKILGKVIGVQSVLK